MGQFAVRYGLPAPLAIALRLGRRRGSAAASTACWSRAEAAAVHRDARHLEIVLAINFIYSANETIRAPGHRGAARRIAASSSASTDFKLRRRGAHLRRHLHGLLVARALVRAQPHRLGPARLCGRRRSRSGRSSSGISTNRMLIPVYALAGLICAHRRLGADRPHRLGLADGSTGGSPTSSPSPPW